MSRQDRFRWILALLLVTAAVPVLAGPAAQDETAPERDTVRLYTNADLLKFGPPAADSEDAVDQVEPDWYFVEDFLEREYSRFEADRAHELERRRVDIEEAAVEQRRERYDLAGASYLRYPYAHFRGSGRKPHARQAQHASRHPLGPVAPTRAIVPLHARPTPGMAHRDRVIRQSTADPSGSK